MAERAAGRVAVADGVPLSARATTGRIAVDGALGSVFHPQAARVHPAKLVQGLAAAVVRRGATIYESTPVTAIAPGVAHTPFGDVRARYVIRATEGFTAGLGGGAAYLAADELVHDRHRAVAGTDVGADRLGRPRAARR